MKKKVLFGLGLFAIVTTLSFNVTLAKKGSNIGLSLSELSISAKAQAEEPAPYICTSASECDDANGLTYNAVSDLNMEIVCCGVTSNYRGNKKAV